MRVEHFPSFFQAGSSPMQQTSLARQLGSCQKDSSPLEAARQALLTAKEKLEQHRDGRIEKALGGYKALRSRRNSFEHELGVQEEQLEQFQTLSSRRDLLSKELSSARSDYETSTGQDLSLFRRVTALEDGLAAVDRDLNGLVEQANRYANAQRQYAAYLEKTGQNGYAAFQYQDQAGYTRETFASQTADMIGRMKEGVSHWRDRISDYCDQCGVSPLEFERYMEEQNKLGQDYFIAQQRFLELSHAAGGSSPADSPERALRNHFDTVELSSPAQEAVWEAGSAE